jgi:hypothetical protein
MLEVPIQVRGTREVGKSRVASNVATYGMRTLRIILQTYRDYDPFRMFSRLGFLFLIVAVLCGLFTLYHFLTTGLFSPYKWVVFISGGSFFSYLLLSLMGFVIEGQAVIRKNQEKMLYYLKKLTFK